MTSKEQKAFVWASQPTTTAADINKMPLRPADQIYPERRERMAAGVCVICKKPITGFRDELSEKEYRISGMCQECQDSVFGDENDAV